ncbi:hypothetical protein [Cellulophaga sp. HaHa_2_1]|uniref:hypothetical protein n=1 Tax=Cellulophaga sp. HaHa_2_1 TaxID=2749994 RepID=UPI001C4E5759|nr:hypothetical protein [Cellulophaga sp. HaHa_2_1]QXP52620.1 hypothetical protein H0I24_01470 [Cellulophaga sp. HaHa_2_1]
MKVLKSTILKKRKCEFGNFELVPESGWKISQSFIDFESGLLIVSESDENEENWVDTGFGSRTIPNREHRIDIKTGEVLSSEQWTKYFSYETIEQISEDGMYKLITTRVHEPERDSDGIKEELIEIETGKTLSSSDGIAFRKEKRENSLESHYRRKKELEKRKAELESMPTLSQFFEMELEKLTERDVILEYYNSEYIFKLIYTGSVFELLKVSANFRYNLDWNSIKYSFESTFSSIQEFVSEFLTDKTWFLNHSPFNLNKDGSKGNQLLKKFVVYFFNELREKHDFTFDEYNQMQQWENHFYQLDSVKPEEYKQFCSNCKASVSYYPRYPKYICSNCSSKKITDESGLELSFSNIGMSGGLRITYKKEGEIIKEDTSQWQKLCFIEGKRFIATEARFGGIVIQTEK